MTAGLQCDGCRVFAAMPATGWLHLVQTAEELPGFEAFLGNCPHPPVTLSFCSMRCAAEYATARALVEGSPAGEFRDEG